MNEARFLLALGLVPPVRPEPRLAAPAIVGDLSRRDLMPDGPMLPAWAQE